MSDSALGTCSCIYHVSDTFVRSAELSICAFTVIDRTPFILFLLLFFISGVTLSKFFFQPEKEQSTD